MASESTLTIHRAVEFQLPTVPNYIIHVVPAGRREDGFTEGPKTDVADLTTLEIEAIGRAWVAALQAKAEARRKDRR